MSGLRLGDLVLDARRFIYIPSLRAVVCTGLHDALKLGISRGLRDILKKVDSTLADYKPDSFIILGSFSEQSALTGMVRRWGKTTKLLLVARNPNAEAQGMAEALGCEVHQELVWENYRFVQVDGDLGMDLQLLTVAGEPNYAIRVGNGPFGATLGGMKLAVFLKGLRRLFLPSLGPDAPSAGIFRTELERYDAFAVGHQRILPLGKVADLKSFKGIGGSLPISKARVAGRKRSSKEPSLK